MNYSNTSLSGLFYRIKYRMIRSYHSLMFKISSKEDIFSSIYKHNYWGDGESRSGPGSSLEYTEMVREELPLLFSQFGVKRVFDAPCGDYVWMKLVVDTTGIEYIGGDIVKDLVETNNKLHNHNRARFCCHDITTDKPPSADLWICRDALFHLSNRDILMSLVRFSESDIKYLLTTTHKNTSGFRNKDIAAGDFRLIDLFASPFCFPENPLYRFDDYIYPHAPREMCLFTREQILEILPKLKLSLGMAV